MTDSDQERIDAVGTFPARVFRCLAGLAQYGFVGANAAALTDFAALVCRAREVVCYYLLLRDDRSGGGTVRADLWVAPITSPDDAVRRIGVGKEIPIAETESPDAAFLSEVQVRVVALLPELPEIAQQVEHRYTTEADPSLALQVNRQGRTMLGALRRYADCEAGSYVAPLFDSTVDVVGGRLTLEALEKACTVVATRLLQDDQAPPAVSHPVFRRKATLIALVLTRQLYIDALVPYITLQRSYIV